MIYTKLYHYIKSLAFLIILFFRGKNRDLAWLSFFPIDPQITVFLFSCLTEQDSINIHSLDRPLSLAERAVSFSDK